MNRQIPIEQASHAELLQFARDTLGLNLPPNTKVTTLRAKISAAWSKDHINLPVTEAEETTQVGSDPQPVTAEQQVPNADKVRIKIAITEEAGGNEPVPVGVNGRIMLIPRGKEVDIPVSYFEILEHAIAYKYDPMPEGGMNPVPREVPMYPFQVIHDSARAA